MWINNKKKFFTCEICKRGFVYEASDLKPALNQIARDFTVAEIDDVNLLFKVVCDTCYEIALILIKRKRTKENGTKN